MFFVWIWLLFPQMNKASVLNHACLLLSTLPRPLSFLGGESFTLTAGGCAGIKHWAPNLLAQVDSGRKSTGAPSVAPTSWCLLHRWLSPLHLPLTWVRLVLRVPLGSPRRPLPARRRLLRRRLPRECLLRPRPPPPGSVSALSSPWPGSHPPRRSRPPQPPRAQVRTQAADGL